MTETLPFDRAEIEGSIGERFRRVADRVPDRPAVVEGESVTTYAELASAARRIALRLREESPPGPGPVALLMPPGAELFAAMLGALEADRFYVPLDPTFPDARLRSVWDTLDAAVARRGRAAAGAREGARERPGTGLERGGDRSRPPGGGDPGLPRVPTTWPTCSSRRARRARPKGVMQSHRNVLHNVWKLSSSLRVRPDDRITLLASPSVGASVSDIFGALLNGAAVCPHALAGDGLRGLPDFLERRGDHDLSLRPERLSHPLRDARRPPGSLAGARGQARGRAQCSPPTSSFTAIVSPRRCVFQVGYGATEINVIRQWSAGPDAPWPGGIPLGYAVDETEVVLLDAEGRETEGEGEIGIRARTLAVGYWKDPELDRVGVSTRWRAGRAFVSTAPGTSAACCRTAASSTRDAGMRA